MLPGVWKAMDRKQLRELESVFVTNFAPAEATSYQEFLHDFEGVVSSSMDSRALGRCLNDYLVLLEAASFLGLRGVVRVLSASELVLGNLLRSRRAGVAPPIDPVNTRLVDSIRNVLKQVGEDPAMSRPMDVFKRLEAIAAALGGEDALS